MSDQLQDAIDKISSAIMFENWIRFYFIVEKDDKLHIHLPEKAMEQIGKRYARFYDLAERLNNAPISHENSMKEVCLFIAGGFDGRQLPEELISQTFASKSFQFGMELFGYWVQTHEDQLDASFMEFSEWQRLFSEWKTSEKVQEYRKNIVAHRILSESDGSETVQ